MAIYDDTAQNHERKKNKKSETPQRADWTYKKKL